MRLIAAIVIFAYALVWFHQAGHGELGYGSERTHVHATHSHPFEMDHTHVADAHHDHHHHHDHDHAGHHSSQDSAAHHHCEEGHGHHHYSHEHYSLVSLAPMGKQTGKMICTGAAVLPARALNASAIVAMQSASFEARRGSSHRIPKYLTNLSLRI